MMYNLQYLLCAEEDIDEALSFYEERSLDSALEFIQLLDVSISRLQEFPYSCQLFRPIVGHLIEEYRVMVLDTFPYGVFYVVHEENKTVEIHRVIHLKREIREFEL